MPGVPKSYADLLGADFVPWDVLKDPDNFREQVIAPGADAEKALLAKNPDLTNNIGDLVGINGFPADEDSIIFTKTPVIRLIRTEIAGRNAYVLRIPYKPFMLDSAIIMNLLLEPPTILHVYQNLKSMMPSSDEKSNYNNYFNDSTAKRSGQNR